MLLKWTEKWRGQASADDQKMWGRPGSLGTSKKNRLRVQIPAVSINFLAEK
jgi:hypothetical protein